MATRTAYEPGLFSWVDLMTTDIVDAGDFYREVFGWEARDDGGYWLFSLPGGDVAGGFGVEGISGIEPRWNSYITVADVDASTARAVELGATVTQEPVDAHEAGRMAALTDPTGAGFILWQDGTRFGAEYVNEPNAWSWSELMTRDVATALDFYAQLLGWTYEDPEPGNDYRVIRLSDRQIGGIMPVPEGVPEHAPAAWSVYVNVSDIEATLKLVRLAAGTASPVMHVEGVGPFAVCADRQGAHFMVIQAAEWDD